MRLDLEVSEERSSGPLPGRTGRVVSRPESLTLSFSEALPLTGLSRNTLYSLLKARKVPGASKLGNTWRFHRATLLAWLAGQTRSTDS